MYTDTEIKVKESTLQFSNFQQRKSWVQHIKKYVNLKTDVADVVPKSFLFLLQYLISTFQTLVS